MRVKLLSYTPIKIADIAIGKCWDKQTKDGCNIDRIERVANKNKHSSTIEHLVYSFDIDGISRAVLQELARHRIASFSVKSTRYTLKELRDEEPFDDNDYDRAEKYVRLTSDRDVNLAIIAALNNVRQLVNSNISNDILKYALPEAYKTSLVFTINARSLQNFLELRTSKAALWEIRELAKMIYCAIPYDHKFLFKEIVNDK